MTRTSTFRTLLFFITITTFQLANSLPKALADEICNPSVSVWVGTGAYTEYGLGSFTCTGVTGVQYRLRLTRSIEYTWGFGSTDVVADTGNQYNNGITYGSISTSASLPGCQSGILSIWISASFWIDEGNNNGRWTNTGWNTIRC